jgi:hypothetical protein
MSTDASSQTAIELERRILRALCGLRARSAEIREEKDTASQKSIFTGLRAHQWHDPEHRVVFEALTLLPKRQANELREQLPAQATRMGFPDVNWDEYFAAPADHSSVESLLAALLAASHAKENV